MTSIVPTDVELIAKHEEVLEEDLLHADEILAYQQFVDELTDENEKLRQEIARLTPVEGSIQ
jgi:hypothetical protein